MSRSQIRTAVRAATVALLGTVPLGLPGTPALLIAQQASPSIPTPRTYLGFEVGADRTLADWRQITGYFGALATAAPEVTVDTLGRTTNGLPFIVATISSAANLRKIDAIRSLQAKLADPRRLSAEEEAQALAGQPAVLVISCNIHATEIASSQMAMELAYRLTTNDTLRRLLDSTVVLLIPSMNPDGQLTVTEWYRQNLGTRWEGGPLPWLYHPYVGHDNNRDWYMVTQKETRLVTDLLYRRWFPEIFYDVHQQGNEGMRITVPPLVDPINPNVDAIIVRGISLIGAEMSWALESRGKSGVGDAATYDLWWHGGARSTPTRHNMIGLLTEAASVKIATPITQDTSQLRGHSRGLPRYERRVNFPNPWPGGSWRLRDIVDYELIAAEALVKLAARQRGEFVRNYVALGRKAIRLGETDAPAAYVIPAGQRDPSAVEQLVDVLRVGGVEVERATAPFVVGSERAAAGSYVVRMAQPYRAHAKDLLEVQRFPKLEQWPGGPPERPYDVAGWTLPFQLGVRVVPTERRIPIATTPVTGAIAAGAPGAPRGPCAAPAGGTAGRILDEFRDRQQRTAAETRANPQGARGAAAGNAALDPRDTESYRAAFAVLRAGSPVRIAAAPIATRSGELPAGALVFQGTPRSLGRDCRVQYSAQTPQGRMVSRMPRIALYRPWTGNMDEGWTRWVFDQFGVPHTALTDSMVKGGRLRDQFDVILVPDMSLREMRDGQPATAVPPRYAGGLGASGFGELKTFVEAGGTLVLLDRASEFATSALGVPVKRITVPPRLDDDYDDDFAAGVDSARLRLEPLYAPGSILRVLVDNRQPVGYGMPDTAAVYFTNSVTFEVPEGSPALVVARYPERAEDVLLSGYLQGGAAIAGKAAAVDVPVGAGRVVMFGFRVQYRGQSYGTFRMLFNALLSGSRTTGGGR